MRKAIVTTLIACFAALALVGSATADRPIKFPTPAPDQAFAAGDLCSFPVTIVSPRFNNGFAIIHTQKDGTTWLWGGGHGEAVVTNTANRKSMTINVTGPGKIYFNDDGSIDIVGGGHWLVAQTADDPAPTAPSLWLYSGSITIHLSSETGTQIVGYNGTAPIDVCAALA
jgi:hypothetical protein